MNTEDYITQSERDDVRAAMARMQALAVAEGLCVEDPNTGELVWIVDESACTHEYVDVQRRDDECGLAAGAWCLECGVQVSTIEEIETSEWLSFRSRYAHTWDH